LSLRCGAQKAQNPAREILGNHRRNSGSGIEIVEPTLIVSRAVDDRVADLIRRHAVLNAVTPLTPPVDTTLIARNRTGPQTCY
jgi:hypothetical protein